MKYVCVCFLFFVLQLQAAGLPVRYGPVSFEFQKSRYDSWQAHADAYLRWLHDGSGLRGGTVVTVGSDSGCDYYQGTTRIQDAIDSGASEIRIVNGVYLENIMIDDISVSLMGGYDSCVDAQLDVISSNVNAKATIDGQSLDTVIKITGNTQRNQVNLEKLKVTGGKDVVVDNFVAGGISVASADVALALTSVNILDNEGTFGGGLDLFTGNIDVYGKDVMITTNKAKTAGGVYCGGGASLLLEGASGVSLNESTQGNGGGLFIEQGCSFTMFSGTTNSSSLRGVALNRSAENGGGIFVQKNGAANLVGSRYCLSLCIGDNINPVNISYNESGHFGAGIFVKESSQLFAYAVDINSNVNSSTGGGIVVADNSTLVMDVLKKNCWDPLSRCNQVRNNESVASGGGIYVRSATTNIRKTHFIDNRTTAGVAIYFIDDAKGYISNSVFAESYDLANNTIKLNGSAPPINLIPEVYLSHVTLANNPSYATNISNSNGKLEVVNSIVYSPGYTTYAENGNAATSSFDCVVTSDVSTLAGGNNILQANPGFVNPVLGDYHISANSVAIDRCPADSRSNQRGGVPTDMDLQIRGLDDPNVVNYMGNIYDAGADEFYADLIFKDDFE